MCAVFFLWCCRVARPRVSRRGRPAVWFSHSSFRSRGGARPFPGEQPPPPSPLAAASIVAAAAPAAASPPPHSENCIFIFSHTFFFIFAHFFSFSTFLGDHEGVLFRYVYPPYLMTFVCFHHLSFSSFLIITFWILLVALMIYTVISVHLVRFSQSQKAHCNFYVANAKLVCSI